MSLFNIFNVAGSAMNAQSQRLNTVASNIANVDSTVGPNGEPYRAKQVIFAEAFTGDGAASGVKVQEIVEDTSPPKKVYDPGSPLADEQGYVSKPNVNVVDEMVNMISATRSYQTNVETMNAAKTMLKKTLTIAQ